MQNDFKGQQLCACASHLVDYWVGCADCYTAHGARVVDVKGVEAAGSSYCEADSTPTAGLLQAARYAIREMMPMHEQSTVGPDPLSGSTAVSLYFTPPVSAAMATHIPELTNAAGKTTLSLSPYHFEQTALPESVGTGPVPCTSAGSNITISTPSMPATPTDSIEPSNESSRNGAAIAVVFGLAALVVYL